MQAPRNAYDLFPADQFDAWIDGVRAKIIDGLEHQHAPEEHEVRIPELSSQALEAIKLARREAEYSRQAGPSSSHSQVIISERYEVEREGAGADETVVTEAYQSVVTRRAEQQPSSEQDEDGGDNADDDDEDGDDNDNNVGYFDENMEDASEIEASPGAYSASTLPETGDYHVNREEDVSGSDNGNDDLRGDGDDEIGSEAGEESEDDDIIMLEDSYEEGSDREMTPDGEGNRDELESDDGLDGHNDGDHASEYRQTTASPYNDQVESEQALAPDQWLEEAIHGHSTQLSPVARDERNADADATAQSGEPEAEGETEGDASPMQSDDDASEGEQSESENGQYEESSGRSGPDDGDVISVADSSDEEERGAGIDDRSSPREIAHDQEEEDEEEEDENADMEEQDSVISEDNRNASQEGDAYDGESEDELEDDRSHRSAEEDRAQHRGLHQDVRQPTMPPTEETDGVYRGPVEIDGTAQEGVRMDEAYQLEEDDNDSQHDPEYSADERDSADDIQYGDDDRGGMLPMVDGHVPTTEEIYASQIPLEAQNKEDIEREIRQHGSRDFIEQPATYVTEREEYDLDGEDGAHHVDGVPAGHENDEVVDETDPRDLEIASWGNEEPAALQPVLYSETRSETPEDQTDVRQSPDLRANMPPALREETDEMVSSSLNNLPLMATNAVEEPDAAPNVNVDSETSGQVDSSESVGGNETDNEDNDMDVESTSVPAVISSTALDLVNQNIEESPLEISRAIPLAGKLASQEGAIISDCQGISASAEPASTQTASSSTVQPEKSSTYGQETGYIGDDELLSENDLIDATTRDEISGSRSGHEQIDVDDASGTADASQSTPSATGDESVGLPSRVNQSGITLLTDQNVAQLPGFTETPGGALQRSDVDAENASAQSVVDVDMGQEAPIDRLVSALREVPDNREEGGPGVSQTDGCTSGRSSRPESSSGAGPSFGGDSSQTPLIDARDQMLHLIASNELSASNEPTPPEEEDMFSMPNVRETSPQGPHNAGDAITTALRALPDTASSRTADDIDPHLPIDTSDPALALQPVILQEHVYRSAEHSDHAAELARLERDSHIHAFQESAEAIREDVTSDIADSGPTAVAYQPESSAQVEAANLIQSDQIADTGALSGQEVSGSRPEVEQEEFETEYRAYSEDQRDELAGDQASDGDQDETAGGRSNRSDSGVQVTETSIASLSRAESPRDANDGVEISIVRVHEYSNVIRDPEPTSAEPKLASVGSNEPEADQSVLLVDPMPSTESIGKASLPLMVGPLEAHPRIQDSVPAPCIPMETPDYGSRPDDTSHPPPPGREEREAIVASPDVRHHHHGSGHRPSRATSHQIANTESPASHTRSHCVYHKLEFDEGVHSHTLLIPGCSLGTVEQREENGARDLGEASGDEMKTKQDLLFGENFTQQMRSEEEGTLPSDLEHRLSLIVGRELLREGHCFILPLAPGVPHAHPQEAAAVEEKEEEEEEEDGGIASRTRRRTSRTPGPTSASTPVTPAQKRRRSRGPSASRTPASSSKKKMPDLSNVEEAGEEMDDGNRDEISNDEESERSKKKRIIDVDGEPQAVDTIQHERSRDEEDGDRMDIDERVDMENMAGTEPANRRKGWFGWLWGSS